MNDQNMKPVAWQFYQDGRWHNGLDTNDHRANTEKAGIQTRNLYPAELVVEMAAELEKWLTLTDPVVLHQNLLNGIPARLSQEQLLHLAGYAHRKTGDGWIPWDGGECPVDSKSLVNVQMKDGEIFTGAPARFWDWSHERNFNGGDIIAYKIVGDNQ